MLEIVLSIFIKDHEKRMQLIPLRKTNLTQKSENNLNSIGVLMLLLGVSNLSMRYNGKLNDKIAESYKENIILYYLFKFNQISKQTSRIGSNFCESAVNPTYPIGDPF